MTRENAMAPRPRTDKNKKMPDNVKVDRKYDKDTGRQIAVYYYYIMPDETREPLPRDEKQAREMADALNLYFASEESKAFVARAIEKYQDAALVAGAVNQLINEFIEHWIPNQHYSDRTLAEKRYKLEEYRREWGPQPVVDIRTMTLTRFINQKPTSSYIKHRTLLIDLFSFAIHQGYREDNPAGVIMVKRAEDVKKKPHTREGFQKTYDASPDWLKRAMNIALRSLQRRGDLSPLHRDQVDLKRNTITILQAKTRKYKTPIYIEIEMGPELKESVMACIWSGIKCPYLLHYRPLRMTKQVREAKRHPFAVTEEYISKQFSKYRDIAGAYDHLAPEERPTFHSLRGLGIFLYREAGYSDEYIQALSGHASADMIEYYADGHKLPVPKLVKADLVLAGVSE